MAINKHLGYVSVWRDILKDEDWLGNSFTEGQALVDLWKMATYKEQELSHQGKSAKVEQGFVFTSVRDLKKRWKWGDARINAFLKQKELEQVLIVAKNQSGLMISLNDYRPPSAPQKSPQSLAITEVEESLEDKPSALLSKPSAPPRTLSSAPLEDSQSLEKSKVDQVKEILSRTP